jgi:hypothetical protein
MEPTPYRVRSCVAPASGRGSCPAFGSRELKRRKQKRFDPSNPGVVLSAIMNKTSRILPMQSLPSPAEILAWAEQDGVDLSMLRERLRLTPTERVQRHQAALALVEALRAAKRKQGRAAHRTLTDGAVQG